MAKDFYHEHVREALECSGWTVTHDPYPIKIGKVGQEIDFGAEQLFAAEKGEELIAVEVKSFVGLSNISEFHRAVGQFINYSVALTLEDSERSLFLAVPLEAWEGFFQEEIVQQSIRKIAAKILVYDPLNRKIVAWKTF